MLCVADQWVCQRDENGDDDPKRLLIAVKVASGISSEA